MANAMNNYARLAIFLATISLILIFSNVILSVEGNIEPSDKQLSFDNKNMCNCVAFRLDDIQDYWLNDVQIEAIKTFQKNKVPLTLGIIGGDNIGLQNDVKLLNLIKSELDAKNSLIELANHGWNHEDFTTMTSEKQIESISKTNQKIHGLFGKSPSVFIPPYNRFNNDTVYAMQKNGITHFSAMLETSNFPDDSFMLGIHHFPETASTGRLDDNLGVFIKIPNKETLESVDESIKDYGFAVITLHPMEFALVDETSYANEVNHKHLVELEQLIQTVKQSDRNIVFLSNINDFTIPVANTRIGSDILQADLNNLITLLFAGVLLGSSGLAVFLIRHMKKVQKNLIYACVQKGGHFWKFIPVKGYYYGPDYFECVQCFEKRL